MCDRDGLLRSTTVLTELGRMQPWCFIDRAPRRSVTQRTPFAVITCKIASFFYYLDGYSASPSISEWDVRHSTVPELLASNEHDVLLWPVTVSRCFVVVHSMAVKWLTNTWLITTYWSRVQISVADASNNDRQWLRHARPRHAAPPCLYILIDRFYINYTVRQKTGPFFIWATITDINRDWIYHFIWILSSGCRVLSLSDCNVVLIHLIKTGLIS